ncbi:MAG: integration host factor subunit beta [Candidatus Tectomicrobia bacterium]|uniref:Integration host factor subunit beta n=1 Tax=Tectimicrobiota bacterium TaxID=2528274 RepID=A0A932GP13_UNCTE|nr:integration host factor subunit beta [Candidatus Tectomicrobia bacterium]
MTKAELIEKLSEKTGLSKVQAEVAVNTTVSSIQEALSRGDKVELRGFGSFRVRQRRARMGRNPKTGTSVDVPAKKVPYFKAGKELQEIINQ